MERGISNMVAKIKNKNKIISSNIIDTYISYAEKFSPYILMVNSMLKELDLDIDDIEDCWNLSHILPPSSVHIKYDQRNVVYTINWKYKEEGSYRLKVLYDGWTKLPVPFTIIYTQSVCRLVECSYMNPCLSCLSAKIEIIWKAKLYGEFHAPISDDIDINYSSIKPGMKLPNGEQCPSILCKYLN